MYCTRCGTTIAPSANFCTKCRTMTQAVLPPQLVPKRVDFAVSYINLCSNLTRNKYSKYVVIDFETTGLSPKTCEIIEYAAVTVENNQIQSSISSLCRPDYPIPHDATRINGITNQMVRDKSNFSKHLDSFLDYVGDGIIVAHNASFDIGFLNRYCKMIGRPMVTTCACTMKMARTITGNKIANYKLATLASYFSIDNSEYHRAKGDAITTAKILIELFHMTSAKRTIATNSTLKF